MKTIKKLMILTLFMLNIQTISQASQLSAEQEADTPMSREALIKDIVDMYPQYVEGFQVLGRGDHGFSNFLDKNLSRDDNEESNAGEVLEAALDEIEDGMQATFIQALQKSNPDFIHTLKIKDLHTMADLSPLAPVMKLAHSTDPIVSYAMKHSGLLSTNQNRASMLPVIQGWVQKWLVNTPDTQDKHGETLLSRAVDDGNLKQMQLFIHAGANVDAKNRYGITPLHKATALYMSFGVDKAIAAMKILLAARANINSRNQQDDSTSLMNAAYLNDIEMVKFLIDAGANPNLQKRDGGTALLLAVSNHNLPIIEMLLAAHADPNIQDRNGYAPLHEVNSIAEAQALLDAGANPNLRDNEGETPAEIAILPEIRDLLMQHQNGGR